MEECRYCQILKEPKNVLYEDEKLVAIVPERPISAGHIQIIAKQHQGSLQDIEDKDVEHMFYAASFGATSLFEGLEAHGTNIIANTGGQLKKGGHFHIDVIARKNDDSLNFLWKPKKPEDPEMEAVQGKIKDKTAMIGAPKKKKEVLDLDKKEVEKLEPGRPKAKKEESEKGKQEPEIKEAEKSQNPSEDKKQSPEPEPKSLPTEKEQRYQGKEKDPKEKPDIEVDDENYLVKQLRRMP